MPGVSLCSAPGGRFLSTERLDMVLRALLETAAKHHGFMLQNIPDEILDDTETALYMTHMQQGQKMLQVGIDEAERLWHENNKASQIEKLIGG